MGLSKRMVIRNCRSLALIGLIACASSINCQLPDDMQRELNQNLEQQARLQALRHQQLHMQRLKSLQQPKSSNPLTNRQQTQPYDPNNYSYEQVSPPVQYSYYQPFGDAAQPPAALQQHQMQPRQQQAVASQQAPNFDMNGMNFGPPTPVQLQAPALPIPQAQVSGQQNQQPNPLTEADFRDITEGQNYGEQANNKPQQKQNLERADQTDEQLAAMGLGSLPGASNQPASGSLNQGPNQGFDFDSFGLNQRPQQQRKVNRAQVGDDDDGSDNLSQMFGGNANIQQPTQQLQQQQPQRYSDFDFGNDESSQAPSEAARSSRSNDGSTSNNQSAPASLQSLLGANFPGLIPGGGTSPAMEAISRGSVDPQRQNMDSGVTRIADLGDRSDEFSGADLGGFEQPAPRKSDQDFNFASAAAEPQPSVVPYPDGAPQPMGALLTLAQPQSLSQKRYNALPDKGTYTSYPAYEQRSPGDPRQLVRAVVATTPRARPPGLGRYGWVGNGNY